MVTCGGQAGRVRRLVSWSALAATLALTACGGGGDAPAPGVSPAPVAVISDPNAPAFTGNTATDAINWFNFRRQQAGLPALARNTAIDAAAQGHSTYQGLNDTITHVQVQGKPGFTGVQESDRLRAAGYLLPPSNYAYGEVIDARGDTSGVAAAEDLIGAIYHRFLVMEPMYKEAGAGAATSASGATYMTVDLAAIGLNGGLAANALAVYPFSAQTGVPARVSSDAETPDPVPGINLVGYPASVHANLTSVVAVQAFTMAPRGGAALPVRLFVQATDAETPPSAAAIIPLSPLAPGTLYDVQFVGTVNGTPVTRAWSFTTQ